MIYYVHSRKSYLPLLLYALMLLAHSSSNPREDSSTKTSKIIVHLLVNCLQTLNAFHRKLS